MSVRRIATVRLLPHALLPCALFSISLALATATWVSSATGAPSRMMAWCDPEAWTPTVNTSNHTARARGKIECFEGAYDFDYAYRLYNNSGGILWDSGLNHVYAYIIELNGPSAGCAGAVVKSWVFANMFGDAASDTSGTNSDCAY